MQRWPANVIEELLGIKRHNHANNQSGFGTDRLSAESDPVAHLEIFSRNSSNPSGSSMTFYAPKGALLVDGVAPITWEVPNMSAIALDRKMGGKAGCNGEDVAEHEVNPPRGELTTSYVASFSHSAPHSRVSVCRRCWSALSHKLVMVWFVLCAGLTRQKNIITLSTTATAGCDELTVQGLQGLAGMHSKHAQGYQHISTQPVAPCCLLLPFIPSACPQGAKAVNRDTLQRQLDKAFVGGGRRLAVSDLLSAVSGLVSALTSQVGAPAQICHRLHPLSCVLL